MLYIPCNNTHQFYQPPLMSSKCTYNGTNCHSNHKRGSLKGYHMALNTCRTILLLNVTSIQGLFAHLAKSSPMEAASSAKITALLSLLCILLSISTVLVACRLSMHAILVSFSYFLPNNNNNYKNYKNTSISIFPYYFYFSFHSLCFVTSKYS